MICCDVCARQGSMATGYVYSVQFGAHTQSIHLCSRHATALDASLKALLEHWEAGKGAADLCAVAHRFVPAPFDIVKGE